MKRLPLLVPFACLFLSVFTVHARLDETVPDIEARYGKSIKSVKSEYSATVAWLYETNGFRITVGFCESNSCYEQFQKIDPKQPKSFIEISETERESLLKANCKSCDWEQHVGLDFLSGGSTSNKTIYNRSDGLATATYHDDTKVLDVRSLLVEKQNEENEKNRQRENLKGF